MSGGIIIQRRAVLLPTAQDSSIYGSLPAECRQQIDDIAAKAPADVSQDDINLLGALINLALHCQ